MSLAIRSGDKVAGRTMPAKSTAAAEPPGKPVPLSEFEHDLGGLEFEQEMQKRRQVFAEQVGDRILRLFKISVLSTVGMTFALAAIDAWFIYRGSIQPASRLVTPSVIMSIIGASIVQVGAASSAIVYSLFKQGRA